MPGVFLWGWDGSQWVKVLVDSTGRLIIDPSEMLEDTPTDGEVGKAPTSNWAHDHGAAPSAHHDKYTDVEALAQGEVAVGTHEGEADPHTGYQKESEKDAASGYAGLNASSFLALAQIIGLVPALDAAGKLILTGTSQIGTKATDLAALWDKTTKIDHGADVDGLSDDDHTQYILKALLTTAGDIIKRGASVPERLAIGDNDEVLTVVSGVPSWAAPAGGAPAWGDITGKPTAPSLEEMATEHENDGTHEAITPTSCSLQYSAPTRSFFVYPQFGNGTEAALGDHSQVPLTAANYRHFNFTVPTDFSSLTKVYLWIYAPTIERTIDYTVTTDFGAAGEDYNNHSDSVTADSVVCAASQLKKLDISAAFTGIAVGDKVGVKVLEDNGTLFDLMILEFQYAE